MPTRIVCSKSDVGALVASCNLEKFVGEQALGEMKRRLMRRKDSPVTDVACISVGDETNRYSLIVTMGVYSKECCHFLGLTYARDEVERLLGGKTICNIDCSGIK